MSAVSGLAETQEIVRREPLLPDLALLLDAEALSDALGSPVRIERLRYKPGSSTVVSLRDRAGRAFWAAAHADPAKIAKHARRAARLGASATPIGHAALSAPAVADRALARGIEEAALASSSGEVLRYNPFRRLVVRSGGHVVKASAREQDVRVPERLAARGIPVLVPRRLGARATTTTWWGEGDLASVPSPTAARAAGRALAALHRVPVDDPPLAAPSRSEVVAGAMDAIRAILPDAAESAGDVAAEAGCAASSRHAGLVHGDLSPDQVLVRAGVIRIIDLDRASRGEPERDLGAFLAAGGDEALVDGYREAGGAPDADAIRAWRAIAHLQRAVEPFRTALPGWPQAVRAEIAAAREVLG
ncbi:phosphotransferase [Microbacterium sp. gxy059]|uniref:phosphotransferase n=1 Tax=Microbacterium sp. gxy059 TaxID=2957199 RepID=UPI003D971EB8